jgi:hypothetical protein
VKVSDKAPILIIGFNRPDLMRRQINALRKFRPEHLYFHIDGPREKSNSDSRLIMENLREIESIDWKASVKILNRDKNIGCKAAVIGAIEWVFESEDLIIVIEDDIEFDEKFINFCNKNLYKKNKDHSILAVCGYNPITNRNIQNPEQVTELISSYPMLWGWATWKEKWLANYEIDPKINLLSITKFLKNNNYNIIFTIFILINIFRIKSNRLDTWDYQLFISSSMRKQKFIIPSVNLTKNLGFREDATHTKSNIGDITNIFKSDHRNYEENCDKNFRRYNIKILTKIIKLKILKNENRILFH